MQVSTTMFRITMVTECQSWDALRIFKFLRAFAATCGHAIAALLKAMEATLIILRKTNEIIEVDSAN